MYGHRDTCPLCEAHAVGNGIVEQIAIASKHEHLPALVDRVRAVAGQGIESDRHVDAGGVATDEELTLIAAEALEDLQAETGIQLSHEASRRNVLTRGIDLTHSSGSASPSVRCCARASNSASRAGTSRA
jgi:MOSC domain-containing protein YiiM